MLIKQLFSPFMHRVTGLITCTVLATCSVSAQFDTTQLKPTPQPLQFSTGDHIGRSFIVPALLISPIALYRTSLITGPNAKFKEESGEHFPRFHTSIDNYLQFAPIALGYAMLIHNKQHSFWGYTEKILLTEVITTGLVQTTKGLTKEQRPDGTSYNSFPSGHTAQAFAGATIFVDEFARHNFWLAAGVYTGAASVGVLRVMNNRHWAGDVIAGAGFGILSAKVSELILKAHERRYHALKPLNL